MAIDIQRFIRLFEVPEVALPYLQAMVDEQEMLLVLAANGSPLTLAVAAQALDMPLEAAAQALDRAYRGAVFDRHADEAGRVTYTPTSFYTRMDIYATFDDGWYDLPVEGREAMDEWMLLEYIERVRPNVGRLMAGQEAEGSPGNDSVLLLEELDAVVDAASTIAVFPCNCRRLGKRCKKPVETCVQFDDTARKKLDRGYGRELTAAEAKDILAMADRKGLMHTTDLAFGEDGPAPICNCCADDCYVFRAAERLGSKGAWPRSRYVASFDEDSCQMCGACTKRCHFGAFHHDGTTVERGGMEVKRVVFDPEKCWGCGLCTATCLTDSITMVVLQAS